ncbi:MAG: heavy-metal-associated domain-containing protein [Bacteroidetes bacterium]|nr:heavy-metal-associated domain-containing protein [Bacteroidota bacterium]
MKTPLLKIFLLLTLFLYSCGSSNSTVEKTVKVWGNCEKCKTRIETAAKINGVSKAEWNMDSKLLKFKVDTSITTINAVLKSVAHAGHDNEVFFADDYAYSRLPESCQYERRAE